ncbi:hypothetical protein ACWD33_14835 [Streptomyces xiamenensis]
MTRRARTAAGAAPAGFRDRPFPASVLRLIVDDHGGESGRGGPEPYRF